MSNPVLKIDGAMLRGRIAFQLMFLLYWNCSVHIIIIIIAVVQYIFYIEKKKTCFKKCFRVDVPHVNINVERVW